MNDDTLRDTVIAASPAPIPLSLSGVDHVKIAGDWHRVVPSTWWIGESVSFSNRNGLYIRELRIPWFKVREWVVEGDNVGAFLTGPLSAIQTMRSNEPLPQEPY